MTGLLLSDDLAMRALAGASGRAPLAALAAGCDLALYCTGRLDENAGGAGGGAAAGCIAAGAARRRAGELASRPLEPFDAGRGAARLDALLAGAVA